MNYCDGIWNSNAIEGYTTGERFFSNGCHTLTNRYHLYCGIVFERPLAYARNIISQGLDGKW